jgi:hypothetical protein
MEWRLIKQWTHFQGVGLNQAQGQLYLYYAKEFEPLKMQPFHTSFIYASF